LLVDLASHWLFIDVDDALELARQAEAVAREIDDDTLIRGVLQGLALTLISLGDFAAAERAVQESIERSAAAGDRYTMLFGLTMRGVLRGRLGRPREALEDHREALREAVAIGSLVGIAIALESAGLDAGLIGDHATAATLGAGAVRIRADAGGGPSVSSAGFPLPSAVAAEHLPPAEVERLSAEARALATEELIRRAIQWLDTESAALEPDAGPATGG